MKAELTVGTLTEARKTLGDNLDENKIDTIYKERIKKAGDVAQLVECLLGMHKALDSIPNIA